MLVNGMYGTHNSSSPATPLVKSSGENQIPVVLRVLVHRCLHNKAPLYLAETLHLTTEVDARRHLRTASTSTLTVPSTRPFTIGEFQWQRRVPGTLCHRASGLSRL